MTVEELRDYLTELSENGWADTEVGMMVADMGFLPIDFIGLSTENVHFMTGVDSEDEPFEETSPWEEFDTLSKENEELKEQIDELKAQLLDCGRMYSDCADREEKLFKALNNIGDAEGPDGFESANLLAREAQQALLEIYKRKQ